MSVKINPLPGHVVLKKHDGKQKSRNNLLIPDSVQQQPEVGEVLAVGQGHFQVHIYPKNDPEKRELAQVEASSLMSEGDLLAYKKYEVQELKYQGEEFILAPFTALLGVIKDV